MRTKQAIYSVLFVVFVMGITMVVTGGNLNPSAPPTAGTMKTLDQVEARIPIPGDAYGAGSFTISQPGSYYLTGDRLVNPNTYGLHITASDVTVDLNGFTLRQIPTTFSYSGINVDGADNVEIRNGTVRDFGGSGIVAGGSQIRILDMRVLHNGGTGINCGANGNNRQIRGCTVSYNGSGIYAWNNSVIIGNTCNNNGTHGIFARHGSVVAENSCYENERGIFTYHSLVNGNACYGNTVADYSNDTNSTYVNNL